MPYINSKLSVKLTDEQKDSIKEELGKIISEIPGKSEEWLMVGFDDNKTLYFRGEKKEKAAFVEVKIFGTAEKSAKNRITALICALLEEKLGIPKDSTYITFDEIKDWGWNGNMF